MGWKGESRRHSLSRKGIKTFADKPMRTQGKIKRASGFLEGWKWGKFTPVESKENKYTDFLNEFRKIVPNEYEVGVGHFDTSDQDAVMPYVKKGDKIIAMDIDEHEDRIHLSYLQANKLGGGLGSVVMNYLNEYAIKKKKYLNVGIVNNPRFFNKFDFLQRLDDISYTSKWHYEDLVEKEWITPVTEEDYRKWAINDKERYGDCTLVYCEGD